MGGVRLVTTTAANDNNNNATSQYNIDVQNAADGAQTTPISMCKMPRMAHKQHHGGTVKNAGCPLPLSLVPREDNNDDGRGRIYIPGGCPKKSSLESTIEIEERTAMLLYFRGEDLFA
jgi:hypothetical protein